MRKFRVKTQLGKNKHTFDSDSSSVYLFFFLRALRHDHVWRIRRYRGRCLGHQGAFEYRLNIILSRKIKSNLLWCFSTLSFSICYASHALSLSLYLSRCLSLFYLHNHMCVNLFYLTVFHYNFSLAALALRPTAPGCTSTLRGAAPSSFARC